MTRRATLTAHDELNQLLEGQTLSNTLICERERGGCGATKPEGEFYEHGNGKGGKKWRRRICRDCENKRQRRATPTRAIRNRARHRAFQRLADLHAEQFQKLLAEEIDKAAHEHDVLQAIGALTVPEGEPVRLRPGPKREGQTVTERIDVARCKTCHTNHDRGHVCPSCGSTEEE